MPIKVFFSGKLIVCKGKVIVYMFLNFTEILKFTSILLLSQLQIFLQVNFIDMCDQASQVS